LPTAAEAERKGYIACSRCHPDSITPAEKSIQIALEFIEARLDHPITLRSLSQASGMSPNHLQRVFTRIVGLSPKAFGNFRRLDRLKSLLRSGVPVSGAAQVKAWE
jgi:AraC family transcriptional regulator of adaptative response/methylated-DNA-[protein]-cysteine methyltransferase